MSIEHVNAVLNLGPEVNGTRRLVLLVLADYASSEGVCFPSMKTVARRAGIVRVKTAQTAIAWLEAEGYLERKINGWAGFTGEIPVGKRTNVIRLYLPRGGREVTRGGGREVTRGGGREVTTQGGAGSDHQNHQLEPSIETTGATASETGTYSQEFEAFWQAFPARTGANPKKAAFRAWQARKREGIAVADLMAAVQQYARTRVGEDPRFTKMAQTYLGPDEHWKADLEVVKMNQAAGVASPEERRATCPVCMGTSWESEPGQPAIPCRGPECRRGTVPDLSPAPEWADGVEPF